MRQLVTLGLLGGQLAPAYPLKPIINIGLKFLSPFSNCFAKKSIPTTPTHISQLASRIKESDHAAYQELFNLLWKPMYVFANSLIMEESIAQDIVQEIWMDYWKRRTKIDPQYIKPYLYKAVRNRVYKHFRDTKLNEVQLEAIHSISTFPEIEDHYAFEDLNTSILTILQKLPNRCQEIFKLSKLEGLDNNEIAHQIGISKRTVENQLSMALTKIKENYNPS